MAEPGFELTTPGLTARVVTDSATGTQLLPMQQTTFENIVTKGEMALNKLFLLLRQCFQLLSINTLSIIEHIHIFV